MYREKASIRVSEYQIFKTKFSAAYECKHEQRPLNYGMQLRIDNNSRAAATVNKWKTNCIRRTFRSFAASTICCRVLKSCKIETQEQDAVRSFLHSSIFLSHVK